MTPEQIRERLGALIGEEPAFSPGPVDPSATVPPARWVAAARALRDAEDLDFAFLCSLSGVDWPAAKEIELVAHLFSYTHRHAFVLKTRIDREAPRIDTISAVWPAANWYERELFDLLGVDVIGHPGLTRLLLPEDWVGHPLRKDYVEEPFYRGIPTRRPGQAPRAKGEADG